MVELLEVTEMPTVDVQLETSLKIVPEGSFWHMSR